MATKSTKSTWVVIAAVGIAIYAAWKIIPAFASKVGGGGSGSNFTGAGGGYPAVDENGYGSGYGYPQQNPLQQLLGSLGSLFSGKSSGGGSGSSGGSGNFGSGNSATSAGGYQDPVGGDLSEAYKSSDPIASILTDLGIDTGAPGPYDLSANNPDSAAGYQIPYEDANGQLTLVPTGSGLVGSDSSSSDSSVSDGGYADVQTYQADTGISDSGAGYPTGADGSYNSGGDAGDTGGDYYNAGLDDGSGDDGGYDSGD